MPETLFLSLDSGRLAHEIARANESVCFAAPGILPEPAAKLAALAQSIGPQKITVCLDFDERVMRMGFGTLDAVQTLRGARIEVRSTPGLRTGLIVIDETGYIFTPTALYLEADERSNLAPNAMRLSRDQVTEALARLSPAAKAIAVTMARTEQERERIREQDVEVLSERVRDSDFKAVEDRLKESPPANFDVARQVRVFDAYLQYVELHLTGAAIQRNRLAIPSSIQKLGGPKDLEGRLKTTFDLIEKGGRLSSKDLENNLNEIRKDFTPSLGKNHGRVVLKAAKQYLEERIAEFRSKLKAHQENVEKDLQNQIDESRNQIVDYYVPTVVANPPDAMRGQFLKFKEPEARAWLKRELDRIFPRAKDLVKKMQLEVRYKDVTFETLQQDDFLSSVKKRFPEIDWDKAYAEFLAAGERKS